MSGYLKYLEWLDDQQTAMVEMLVEWAEINSGTFHRAGLERIRQRVAVEFEELGDSMEVTSVAPFQEVNQRGEVQQRELGPALQVVRRRDAPKRVVLAIHMDTVYSADSAFQHCTQLDSNRLRGPGVADAKGGLVVMLFALRAFERYVQATGNHRLGWQVLLNADEEIGSPGSAALFEQLAAEVDFGLLYEPSLPDGSLISARKGSGNFSIVVRGQSAHAGREFERGRNAVVAAAEVANQLHRLNGKFAPATFNVARIEGGSPFNVVPDVAVVRFNVRYAARQQEQPIRTALLEIASQASAGEGISAELHGLFSAPPKPFDIAQQALFAEIADCGRALDLELSWQESGGVCDGNRLAAYGVPNADTMGVRGGEIHSSNEYVLLDSLAERAKLTALLLMRWAEAET